MAQLTPEAKLWLADSGCPFQYLNTEVFYSCVTRSLREATIFITSGSLSHTPAPEFQLSRIHVVFNSSRSQLRNDISHPKINYSSDQHLQYLSEQCQRSNLI